MRTDEQIKKDIVEVLFRDDRVDAAKISIKVDRGIATFAGRVSSFSEVKSATSAAWRVEGVRRVVDNLKVAYAATLAIPIDAEIETRVNNIIMWDATIDGAYVKALVNDGIVTLVGDVDAHWKVAYTENRIHSVRGILGIENRLTVVSGRRIKDEVVAWDVMEALDRDTLVDVNDITAEVENGVVRLTGTVPSLAASNAAREGASRTAGVIDIIDNLRISP